MRLLLRLQDTTASTFMDIEVQCAHDATVGELADHLASLTGAPNGLALDGIPRDLPVRDDGPRSGATVSLSPPIAGADEPTGAPVRATILDRESESAATGSARDSISGSNSISGSKSGPPSVQLNYGANALADVVIHVGHRVEVHPTGSSRPLLNGERILGSRRLGDGDLLQTDTSSLLIRIGEDLDPPPTRGPAVAHPITLRTIERPDPERIDFPVPPDRTRLPGFPFLSALVPLLMGAGLWLATKSMAAALFVLFSFVFVLASGLETRREARADQRFRLKEFRLDVEETTGRLEERERLIRESYELEAPAPVELSAIGSTTAKRVWERTLSDTARSPFRVRLGTARVPTPDSIVVPEQGRRELRRELELLCAEHQSVELPVIIDLDAASGLAIVGRDEATTNVARWLIAQLVTLLAPDELGVDVLADPSRKSTWAWTNWLPHAHSESSTRTLLIVDGADETEIELALASNRFDDAILLWLSPTKAAIPTRLGYTLELNPEPQLHRNDGALPNPAAVDIRLDDMTEDETLPIARAMAPLTPARSPLEDRSAAAMLPTRVGLADVLSNHDLLDGPEMVVEQWQSSSRSNSLTAPVGRLGNGILQLDLTRDGPHTLVAGTTGSGKSEFLRSLIGSLALHHGPERLTFLLIDYKGGAAFGPLEDLPHTVGLITDLSPVLALRALTSLRAEVIRREEVLANSAAGDIAELRALASDGSPTSAESNEAMPALVVVVDEFATLAKEIPSFVDGLVDLAQRGRSLGIHLVLATQRPAGVVTDSIRANTSLRIALRMAEADDSRDVVESSEAALLSRETPGRALVRIGSSGPLPAQFAHSGGPSRKADRVRSRPLGEQWPETPADRRQGPTQLDVAVTTTCSAAELSGLAPPRRPWLPPLPGRITHEELRVDVVADRGTAAIGLVDRPERQRMVPLVVDFDRDGGVLVLGASGSGRTTTLATISAACLLSSESSNTPSRLVHLYGIDACGGRAGLARLLPNIDVIDAADAERVLRLLRRCHARVLEPGISGTAATDPRTIIVVDGLASLEEAHEHINRGEAMDLLERLARDGRNSGVHLVIAATRRSEVAAGLAASLGCHIHLRSSSEDEATMLGLDPTSAAPDVPPGRGHVRGEQIQIAVPPEVTTARTLPRCGSAPRIRSLGTSVSLTELEPHPPGSLMVPVGLNGEDFSTSVLDLSHHHAIVAGPRRSGRTSTLRLIAESLRRSTPTVGSRTEVAAFRISADGGDKDGVWDSTFSTTARRHPGEVAGPGSQDAEDLDSITTRAVSAAHNGAVTVVVVDDLPDLLDGPLGGDVERALAHLIDVGSYAPLRIVLSGEVEAMSRAFSGALSRVRSGRTGILLQPDPDMHGALLHAILPRRDELQWPAGRGWLITESLPTLIQTALV